MCRAVKPPPFDKGGKFSADAKQAERSLKGKGVGVRRGGGCSFKMAVRMERFGATGGASKARMP